MKTLKAITNMIFAAIMLVLLVVILESFSAKDTTSEQYLEIIRVDGCEYVKHKYTSRGGIEHHGACDNH